MMKKIVNIFLLAGVSALVFCGCRNTVALQEQALPPSIKVPESFVAVFAEGDQMRVFGNPALAECRFPPCSTFKIISTLMGLDCGVVHDLNSRLGYDGTKYENANWNRDVTLREAFQFSCVPYYKKLTGKLQKGYVQNVLEELDYGNCDLSVWNSNGHNVFWIESSLLISPLEQIGVLKRICSGATPFSPGHVAMLRKCMYQGPVGQWTLFGKTGTGRNHNSNFLEAWFVGYAENKAGRVVYFALHGAAPGRDVVSPELRKIAGELLEHWQ